MWKILSSRSGKGNSPDALRDQVRAALAGVTDPDRGENIVDLGMVSDIVIEAGHVSFAIEVDPARGPSLEPLRQQAEQAVAAIDGVEKVTAVLTAEREASASPQKEPPQIRTMPKGHAHGPGFERKPPSEKLHLPKIRNIVAVASGKGGVGKSTVSANLAAALAARGLKTGLLDADIYGPSQPRMTGVSRKPDIGPDKKIVPLENHGFKIMSIGFLIEGDEDTPMIWRGPMVQTALVQMLRDVNWGELDVLVIDLPPGTGDAQLTLAQKAPLTGAVIVSTPQDIALIDAKKAYHMFEKVNVPVLGVIENMSAFSCPECGHESHIFGHGGAREEAERLGLAFLGEVPLDIVIRETSDAGEPVVTARPDGAQARAFGAIADRLAQSLADTPASKQA